MQTYTETGLLLSIIGNLVSVVGIMVWKKLNTIEEKVDQNAAMHHKCREELPQKSATKEELKEHKAEWVYLTLFRRQMAALARSISAWAITSAETLPRRPLE
jgi:hypothetical protein